MIKSGEKNISNAIEVDRLSRHTTASGNRLANLELLLGISSKQPAIRRTMSLPVQSQLLYSNLNYIRSHLNHDGINIRFNISMPEPRKGIIHSKTENLSQMGKDDKSKSPLTPQTFELDVSTNTIQKTVACLAPAMRFIVEILSNDQTPEFLGSLPRHLDRAVKLSLQRSDEIDIDKLSQLFSYISYQEFKLKHLTSIEESSRLHVYLDNCTKAEALIIGELIKDDIEFLITHKYGYLIVRSLAGVHLELTTRAENLCESYFHLLATNEYASRTMQKLVEISNSFRLYALKRFSKDTSLWLKSIPGLFVLAACLRFSNPNEYKFVTNMLFSSRSKLIASKIMKRALVSVVEASKEHELERIFVYLKIDRKFIRYLDDKHMTYILIAFIRQDYMPSIKLLVDHIESSFKELVSKAYFKLLANKLISVGSHLVLDSINKSLLSLSSTALVNLCDGGRNLPYLYYFVFLAFSSFKTETSEGTQQLLEFAHRLSISPIIQKLDVRLAIRLNECLQA